MAKRAKVKKWLPVKLAAVALGVHPARAYSLAVKAELRARVILDSRGNSTLEIDPASIDEYKRANKGRGNA